MTTLFVKLLRTEREATMQSYVRTFSTMVVGIQNKLLAKAVSGQGANAFKASTDKIRLKILLVLES